MYTIIEVGGKSNAPEPFAEVEQKNPIPLDTVLEQIRDAPKGRPLFLWGAEPIIHPQFVDMLSACNQHQVFIPSNGRVCSLPEVAGALAQENITTLVHLYGPKEVHDKITGGDFDESLQGIKSLLGVSAKVAVRIPVLRDNLYYIIDTINILQAIGLKEIIVALPAPIGPLRQHYEQVPKFTQMKPVLDEVFDGFDFPIRASGFAPCQLRSHSDHLIPLPYLAPTTKIDVCRSCEHGAVCEGMFSGYHELYGDEEFPHEEKKELTPLERVCSRINKDSLLYVAPDNLLMITECLKQPKTVWDLAYHTGFPMAVTVNIVRELINEGVIEEGQVLSIKKQIAKEPKDIIDPSGDRLPSDPQYTQLTVCQEDLRSRVDYITRTVPSGGRMAVLGDDDFTSLLFASTGLFEVTVFEIDPNICERIREVAKRENLQLTVIQHDLRDPMPEDFQGTMDVFYTDSPYNLNGFTLFISRGIELLKPGPKRHGFSSFSPEMPEMELVELPVQKAIAKMNLFIERKKEPGRNDVPRYMKEKYPSVREVEQALKKYKELPEEDQWYLAALGRKEYMFHFLTSSRTMPLISGRYDGEIYHEGHPLAFYADKEFIKKMKKDFSYLDY